MSDAMKDFIKWVVDVLIVGGVLFVIIDRVKYRRENKSLKKNEVTGSDLDNETKRLDNETKRLENDMKQLDIGSLFLDKVQAAAEVVEAASNRMIENNQSLQLIESNQKRMESNQNRMIKQFDELVTEVSRMKEEMSDIRNEQNMERTFLNGAYEKERQRMLAEANTKDTCGEAVTVTSGSPAVVKQVTSKPKTNVSKTKKNPIPRK